MSDSTNEKPKAEPAPRPQCDCTCHMRPHLSPQTAGCMSCKHNHDRAASSPAAWPQQNGVNFSQIDEFCCMTADPCVKHGGRLIKPSDKTEPAARTEQPTQPSQRPLMPEGCLPTCGIKYDVYHTEKCKHYAAPVAVVEQPNIQRLVNLLNDYQIEARNVDETLVNDCTEILEVLPDALRQSSRLNEDTSKKAAVVEPRRELDAPKVFHDFLPCSQFTALVREMFIAIHDGVQVSELQKAAWLVRLADSQRTEGVADGK